MQGVPRAGPRLCEADHPATNAAAQTRRRGQGWSTAQSACLRYARSGKGEKRKEFGTLLSFLALPPFSPVLPQALPACWRDYAPLQSRPPCHCLHLSRRLHGLRRMASFIPSIVGILGPPSRRTCGRAHSRYHRTQQSWRQCPGSSWMST